MWLSLDQGQWELVSSPVIDLGMVSDVVVWICGREVYVVEEESTANLICGGR